MQQNIASVYQDVADDSMQSASDELPNMANNEFCKKKKKKKKMKWKMLQFLVMEHGNAGGSHL